jgi:hypothetical protein
MMKTTLPSKITTVEEAKEFLTALFDNNESYHPEDDAHDIDWTTCEPTEEEKEQLNKLMGNMYGLNGEPFFDPCAFLWDMIVAANPTLQSDEEEED